MSPTKNMRTYRRDMLIASAMIVTGVTISAVSLANLEPATAQAYLTQTQAPKRSQVAQATPPLQSTPGAENKPTAPQEPQTTGQRPQETAPQPARPDTEAQDSGAKPALPPAPAEKTAPPISTK